MDFNWRGGGGGYISPCFGLIIALGGRYKRSKSEEAGIKQDEERKCHLCAHAQHSTRSLNRQPHYPIKEVRFLCVFLPFELKNTALFTIAKK